MHEQDYQAHFDGSATTAKVHRTCAPSLQEELGGRADQATGCSTKSGSNLDERRDGSGRYRGKSDMVLVIRGVLMLIRS